MASSGRKAKNKGIAARLAAVTGTAEEPAVPVLKRTEEGDKELDRLLHSNSPHVIAQLKKVAEAFSVFDAANKNVIEVREVGCICRALGLWINEEELRDIIMMVEDVDTPSMTRYERFVPYVAKLLLDDNRWMGPSDDDVRMAWKVLDIERMGYFDLSRIRDIMMKEGEPFSAEEFDDMMRFGLNPDDQKFYWEYYLTKAGVKDQEAIEAKREARRKAWQVKLGTK